MLESQACSREGTLVPGEKDASMFLRESNPNLLPSPLVGEG